MKLLRWISPANAKDKWLYVSLVVICEPMIYLLFNNYMSYFTLSVILGCVIFGIFAYDFLTALIYKKKIELTKSYSFWFLVAFIIWLFIGSFFSINKVVTWSGVFNGKHVKESFWQYFCYFLFFCAARQTQKANRYWLTSVIVWLMCLYILLGFVDMYAFPVPGFICNGNKYSLIFYQQNHSGYLASITTILAFYKLCTNQTKKDRIPFVFAFVLHCLFLCCNGSLGPILAVIAAITICCIINLSKKNYQISKRVFAAIFAFVAVFAFLDFVPKVKEIKGDKYPLYAKITGVFCEAVGIEYKFKDGERVSGSDGYERIPMWKNCLKTITERPLFGTGISTFQDKNPEFIYANPHNEFLEYASCCGIPALLLYLAFAFSLLSGLFRKKNRQLHFYNGCAYAIISYLISSFFGCTMGCVMPQLFLVYGMADVE